MQDICTKAKPVEYEEYKFLTKSMPELILSHNTFCTIIDLFNSNPTLNAMYHEVMNDMRNNGNVSMGSAMVAVIQSLLDELESLKSES